jgi:MFS family permease
VNASGKTPSLWIAVGLSLAPAVSNGLGRFAYALILPAMRADLHWSYTQAGWVNTVNALGYFVGAVATLRLIGRAGPHRLLFWGMLSTAASIIGSGFFRGFSLLLLMRFIAGSGGALALIAGGALAAELYAQHPERSAAGIAVYFSGGGIGIVVPGLFVPWLLQARGAPAWDQAWIATGMVAAAFCVPCLRSAARVPELPRSVQRVPWKKGPLLASLFGYLCFALGAIVYMTFIIAWMRDRGATPLEVSVVWSVLGLAIMISPIPWRIPLSRWRGGWPLSAALGACALGAAIPLLSTSLPAMILSAALFGGSFFIPPSAVTALSRARLPRAAWGAGIATYTVLFGAGQPIGPILAGAVADATGTLFAGLATSVAVLLIGAAASALQD